MQTFNQNLVQLYRQGLVKLEHVLASASNPEDVMLAIRGIEMGTQGGASEGLKR